MADTTKTLRLAIAADTNNAEKAFANLNKELKNTGVSIASFSTAIYKNAEGVDTYAHSISLAATSVKKLEDAQKSLIGSSQQGPITSNALRDAEALAKSKADLASKSSADMVAKAKASVTAQLIAIREGENSIAAVKNASAERQKQIETNLQEKLKSIRDRYAAGEFNKGSLDLSIKSITDAYQRQTISLAVETDKRIAKIKEEQAAQEAYSRSLIGRLSSAPRYTPPTSMISGMSEAGRAANASVALPPPPPRVPEDVKNGYDSLFARIGAINIEYRLWNEAINTVTNSLRAIPKIGIELEATKSVLTAVMGSEVGMESVLKSLTKEADRTGMSLEAIRTSFRTFSASTTLAGESLESTWKMFTNMNTVITALHLSTDQANHVFLALSQIFNKSKVQSEELVKQLGNLLPGAFASFAKSMGISTMELANNMKKGTVFAQETVEKFTDYMATRFASAFDTASQGLNANLNRMQSSFIALGEAIYNTSSGPMNSAVKAITELTNYFTAAVKGENDFIANTKILADVLSGVLATVLLSKVTPAIIGVIEKIIEMGGVMAAARVGVETLGKSLLALSGPAVVTGLVSVIAYARQLGSEQASLAARAKKDIEDISAEKKKADMAQPIAIRVENDPNVRANIKNIQEYTAEYNKILEMRKQGISVYAGENGTEDITKAQARMLKAIQVNQEKLKDTKFKAQAQIEAADAEFLKNQITHGVDLTTEIQNAHVTALEAQGKYVEAAGQKFENQTKASFAAAEDQIRQQKARVEKLTKENKEGSYDTQIADAKAEIEKLENFKADLLADKAYKMQQAQERLDKKANASAKSAATEHLKITKEEIGQIREYQRTAANDAENQIKLLDGQNKAKTYSFEEYARRKKEILTKDYEAEKAWYEQQKALAASSGKKGLVTQAEEQLKRLKADYEAKVGTKTTAGIIDTETAKNLQDYETNINMIHEKYRDILGLERDSNDLTSVKLEQLRKQIELESTEKGIQGERAKQALIELDTWQKAKNLKADFQTYQKSLTNADKIASDTLARNNELRQTGNMTELQFLMSNTKIKKEQIRLSEIEIEKMRQRLATASESEKPAVQAQYDLAVQRLESLKLVADETGAFIENALGTAFESSFEGLITKSMTASQAFANFGKSVMQTIAKIVAEEMKSQLLNSILKPLAGAAMGGLGSLFSSSTAAAAGSGFTASNLSSMSSSITPSFAASANGNVFTSPGLSVHSGTIVSSPTVFPFAKGIGLMGEAGPEAILPLKRNSQGKLGVSVENAGQNKGNLYNITVNVQSKQGENPEQFGQRAATAMMRSIAKEEISNARRPGNTLNKARFG